MSIFNSCAPIRSAFSALLLSAGAAFAQTAPAPTKPMSDMHQGKMGHGEMSGMKHGDMKGGMKSSCMSKAAMQKMGFGPKKRAQMSSMCRAERKRGIAPTGAKPKADAMKPMPMNNTM